MAELISREQAYGLAYKAGAFHLNDSFVMDETVLLAFVQACVKLGRNAGLDEAKRAAEDADVVEAKGNTYYAQLGDAAATQRGIVAAIESLKDNTP